MPVPVSTTRPPAAELAARRTERVGGVAASQGEVRAQFNVSIMKASIEVSIQSKNEPLALLLKSAISGINEALAPEFGDHAIEAAAASNLDTSPEATAGRIVALSTGFFEAFKQHHLGEEEADILKTFMETIRQGFEQGFKEAREILEGLGVLDGDIASAIDQTYQLVLKGYADFEATFASSLGATGSSGSSATTDEPPER
jgi:hypothetical protein